MRSSGTKSCRTKTVLVVEDDEYLRNMICEGLHDRRVRTLVSRHEQEAYKMLEAHHADIDCALLDIRLPTSEKQKDDESPRGRLSGHRIARLIKTNWPRIRLVGMSFFAEEEVRDWFHEFGHGYLRKSWLAEGMERQFFETVLKVMLKPVRALKPHSFIVHGHDETSLRTLRKFITDELGWPNPLVLRELPSGGKTIIEKFEDAAREVRVVFVLLTPDDKISSAKSPNEAKRRARQNVIFEMGFFFAKLQRRGGRILLLHKGKVELPSDIQGIVYIDISKGIKVAGDSIRTELAL